MSIDTCAQRSSDKYKREKERERERERHRVRNDGGFRSLLTRIYTSLLLYQDHVERECVCLSPPLCLFRTIVHDRGDKSLLTRLFDTYVHVYVSQYAYFCMRERERDRERALLGTMVHNGGSRAVCFHSN